MDAYRAMSANKKELKTVNTFANELRGRHAKRSDIMKRSRKPVTFVITSKADCKEKTSGITKEQEMLLEECFLVDHDMQVLLHAMELIKQEHPAVNPDNYIGRAAERIRMSEEEEAVLNQRRVSEAEEREKADRKAGKPQEVEGQQKIFDPEKMPSAEAATDVTVRKLEVVE